MIDALTSKMGCPCCGFVLQNDTVVHAYKVLKKLCPGMRVTSWCRCSDHNRKVGGAPNSKHMSGQAIDVVFDSHEMLANLVHYGRNVGLIRAFVYKTHVHLDCYGSKPHLEVMY